MFFLLGKTFDELTFGNYCINCGGKTVVCPHKLTIESSVIKLPLNSTHLMIKRPFIKANILRSYHKYIVYVVFVLILNTFLLSKHKMF